MIGETISHYRIIQKIGAGGMGEVYRAHDDQLNRDVAIKILNAKFSANAHAKINLLREAQSASALNDPHICTIYDVLVMAEQGTERPEALLKWFYPGHTTGNEFVYSTHKEQQLAQDRQHTIFAKDTAEAGD
jgi:serine/threonine protein kinase